MTHALLIKSNFNSHQKFEDTLTTKVCVTLSFCSSILKLYYE